jgi:hypothetical protein
VRAGRFACELRRLPVARFSRFPHLTGMRRATLCHVPPGLLRPCFVRTETGRNAKVLSKEEGLILAA